MPLTTEILKNDPIDNKYSTQYYNNTDLAVKEEEEYIHPLFVILNNITTVITIILAK